LSNPKIIKEISLWYVLAVAALLLSNAIGLFGGFFKENAGIIPALFFLLAPWFVLQRKGIKPRTYGLHGERPVHSIVAALLAAIIVFPPYFVGFGLWAGFIDNATADWSKLPTIGWWLWLFITHFLAIALPEEVFFRGYMQGRLALLFKRRIKIFGVNCGPELVLASALFALIHLVSIPAPFRLAVFFPGLLFGWLKERTGSVLAPALLHAASNVVLAALNEVYY